MADGEPFAPRREFGRTGFGATVLGIGDRADRSVPIEACVATARRALDTGLNVIDTAPNYEDRYSEEIVGRAVRGRRRDAVFVIDKIDRHEEPIGPKIDGALDRLGLDHVVAFVVHNLSSLDAFSGCATSAAVHRTVESGAGGDVPVPQRVVAHPGRAPRRPHRGPVRRRDVPDQAVRGPAVRDRRTAAGEVFGHRNGVLQDVRCRQSRGRHRRRQPTAQAPAAG
jgi:hypothetical protein